MLPYAELDDVLCKLLATQYSPVGTASGARLQRTTTTTPHFTAAAACLYHTIAGGLCPPSPHVRKRAAILASITLRLPGARQEDLHTIHTTTTTAISHL